MLGREINRRVDFEFREGIGLEFENYKTNS